VDELEDDLGPDSIMESERRSKGFGGRGGTINDTYAASYGPGAMSAYSRTSVDPYSVLDKKRESELSGMRREMESLRAEARRALSDAKEARAEAAASEERADREGELRRVEERRRADIAEREKRSYEDYVMVQDRLEARDREVSALSKQLEEAKAREERARLDAESAEERSKKLSESEASLKAQILRLEQDVREAQAEHWTLQDQLRFAKDEGERSRAQAQLLESELIEAKDSLSRARIAQVDAERRATEAEGTLEGLEGDLGGRNRTLQEANARLQAAFNEADSSARRLKAEVEGLEKKVSECEGTWKTQGEKAERAIEGERVAMASLEKANAEVHRLREVNEALSDEVDRCRADLETSHAQRKVDRGELSRLRAKVDECVGELETLSVEGRKDGIRREGHEERERQLQAAMLESDQQRRELDSRLFILEERRKHDMSEFAQLRKEYAESCSRASDLEVKLEGSERAASNAEKELSRHKEMLSDALARASQAEEQLEVMRPKMATSAEAAVLRSKVLDLEKECHTLRELAAKRETEASSARHASRIAEVKEREWTEQIAQLEARLGEADASLLEERERRGAVEARERESRSGLAASCEALRELEGRYAMEHEAYEHMKASVSKLRSEHAAAVSSLKGQTEEIEEAQRLLRDATHAVELEQSKRMASEERERGSTQQATVLGEQRRELEGRVWMLEERLRQDNVALESLRKAYRESEELKTALGAQYEECRRELEGVKGKSRDLASRFRLIGGLRQEFEDAERERQGQEDKYRVQEKELEEAREMMKRSSDALRKLEAKSREDDAEMQRLNEEVVSIRDRQLSTTQERHSTIKSLEAACKGLRERVRELEEQLHVTELRARKGELMVEERDEEIAELQKKIQKLQVIVKGRSNNNASNMDLSASTTASDDASTSLLLPADSPPCGVGAVFAKSGGGFVATSLDVPVEGGLCVGDLAIALDDSPLADKTLVQFNHLLKGVTGTAVKLLVVRMDRGTGIMLPPFDLTVSPHSPHKPSIVGFMV